MKLHFISIKKAPFIIIWFDYSTEKGLPFIPQSLQNSWTRVIWKGQFIFERVHIFSNIKNYFLSAFVVCLHSGRFSKNRSEIKYEIATRAFNKIYKIQTIFNSNKFNSKWTGSDPFLVLFYAFCILNEFYRKISKQW